MSRSKKKNLSPLTGVLEEDKVVIDFGKYEGRSVYEINIDIPAYYEFLLEQKESGNFFIKRSKDKIFKLYISDLPAI